MEKVNSTHSPSLHSPISPLKVEETKHPNKPHSINVMENGCQWYDVNRLQSSIMKKVKI